MKKFALFLVLVSLWISPAWAVDFFTEDFSAGIPEDWTNVNNGGDCVWTSPGTGTLPLAYFGDEYYVEANSDACGSGTTMNTSLITEPINCSDYINIELSFSHYFRVLSGDTAWVHYSIDEGVNWVPVQGWEASVEGNVEVYELPALNGQSNVMFRFTYVAGGWNWYWGIDDITLSGDSNEPGIYLGGVVAASGLAGSDVVYELSVFNNSGSKAIIGLTYSGFDWPTTGPAEIEVANGAAGDFEVTVAVPETAMGGDTDTAGVTASTGGYVDELLLTTTAIKRFNVLPNIPTTVFDHAGFFFDGKYYLAFGATDSWYWTPNTNLYIYDTVAGTWGTGIGPSVNLYVTGGVAIDGKLYFPGGHDLDTAGVVINAVQIYDPGTDSWTTGADALNDSGGYVTATDGTLLYRMGGTTPNIWPNGQTNFASYDPVADAWTALTAAPIGRMWSAGGVIDGTFYVAGGFDGTATATATMDAYDIAAGTWDSTLAAMPLPLWGAGYTVACGKLFVYGGVDGSTDTPTDACYVYDPVADLWSDCGISLPGATFRAAGGGDDEYGLFIAGGRDATGLETDSFANAPDPCADDDDDDDNDDNDDDDNDNNDNDDNDDNDDDNNDNDDVTPGDDDSTPGGDDDYSPSPTPTPSGGEDEEDDDPGCGSGHKEETGGGGGCSVAENGEGGMSFWLMLGMLGGVFLLRKREKALRRALPLVALLILLPVAVTWAYSDHVGMDIQLWHQNLDNSGFGSVWGTTNLGQLKYGVGFYSVFMNKPLMWAEDQDSVMDMVNNRWDQNLYAAFGILDSLDLSIKGPAYIEQEINQFIPKMRAQAWDDWQFFLKYSFLKRNEDILGVALKAGMDVPVFGPDSLTSDGGLTFFPGVIVDVEWEYFILAYNLDFILRDETRRLNEHKIKDELDHRLGLAWKVVGTPCYKVFAELDNRTILKEPWSRETKNPIEFLAGAEVHIWKGIAVHAGGGAGITNGYGSPDYRVEAGLKYFPEPICGKKEKKVEEVKDSDGDGINDDVDQCPNQPEDFDNYKDKDGCPELDNDGDGVLDKNDKCPNEPGLQQLKGCPDGDKDGDGVLDLQDECPNQPGTKANKGCPEYTKVQVTGEKILIKEVVQFRVGSAVILPESFELLDQVAQAIKEYEIKKVRVEGHASSDGNDQKNLVLSQQRADSVRQYLISKGIPEDALIAKGFGETQPIASNNTAEGRKMNRRVEFVVLDEK